MPVLNPPDFFQCVYNQKITYNATLTAANASAAHVTCERPAGSDLAPTPDEAGK